MIIAFTKALTGQTHLQGEANWYEVNIAKNSVFIC